MIAVERIARVRVLRLENGPDNALSLALLAELRDAIAEAAADPGTRCLVLASGTPRYFSMGIDLKEFSRLPAARRAEPFLTLLSVYRSLRELPKPTLAAIGGSAILGGWILAMGCDFRLLTEEGRIALSEIRFGLSPTPVLLRRLRGMSASPTLLKDLVLRGRTLRAPEALAGGFVDRVVPAPALLQEALRAAKSLSQQAPAAYAAVKAGLAEEDDALWRRSRAEFSRLFRLPEVQKSLAALSGKRRTRWED
ncbi:MAG: hypothetical protein A2X36_03150 [Elusimicrobia bacterium GWA2_69_24]|nr:MAG: hypothetical protein A2X36_03150 [Elusimicrobia bacterium GWA2_69_24]